MPESGEEWLSMVSLNFSGGTDGVAMLAFPLESAAKLVSIVSIVTERDLMSCDIDSLKEGALTEIGNIIMNGVMGSFANMLKLRLTYAIPSYSEGPIKDLLLGKSNKEDHIIIMALTNFKLEKHLIKGNITVLFEVESLDKIFAANCSNV
ncbi:MAG: hypothetical protein KAV87_16505 [Desulfobacteraceae bacterium]|nr:hypothetical protein [Desulfobacteraceae bacterium]